MTHSPKQKRILCISKKNTVFDSFVNRLGQYGYFVYNYPDTLNALAHIYNDPPDMILLSLGIKGWIDFINKLKEDPVYGHLPLILIILNNNKKSLVYLNDLSFDDYLYIKNGFEELLMRIRIREKQAIRYLDANPLTRLPGNFSILANIQSSIDESRVFSLGYVDIDNFKAFNDKYGFARGDDMIRMTARILTNVVRRLCPKDGFVGHVGGDDFVFIVTSDMVRECCEQIIQNFDLVGSTLPDDKDRILGFIECEDRQGKMRKFPLPTLSIAVIDSAITKINHPGVASAIAGELKKQVKKLSGSNYMINRRA